MIHLPLILHGQSATLDKTTVYYPLKHWSDRFFSDTVGNVEHIDKWKDAGNP